jgi:Putative prokaryotic signal transducing protein
MSSDSAAPANIVLLDSFSDVIAAHLAKNQLEAAGIPCFLSNESRPYGPVLGSVRLFVRQPDVAAAQAALHPQRTVMHAMPPEVSEEDTAATLRCPRCHHPDVVCRHQPQPQDNLFVKLRLWLLAPEKPQCHCFQCGLDFEG